MRRFHRNQNKDWSVESLESRRMLSVGGGFTAGGVVGDYYNSTDLSGAVAFARQDVRIDFNWGNVLSPGGSVSPGFSSLNHNNFSARWTGQLIPRFSETYTFKTISATGVRLYVKPTASATWTTLIDDWTAHSVTTDTAPYALTAGTTYDVRMEYYQTTGAAVAQLHWLSPSTPEEAIEPISIAGINATTYAPTDYADAMKSGRTDWGGVAQDANGWPLADATNIPWEGVDPKSVAGTYLLTFQGEAQVGVQVFGPVSFVANGTTYTGTLPKGAGYNAATNTTTGTMTLTASNVGILYLSFTSSQRTAASLTNTGVTGIQLMRPTVPGATTFYSPGTLFTDGAKSAMDRFTTERWNNTNYDTTQVNWSDRTLPSYFKADLGVGNEVWEDLVMFANETGKDLYITIPINASTSYVTALAELIKYGSDGVNPYTSPQARPVYPGLDPNLRLYVEWSNEVWNPGFPQETAAATDSQEAVAGNTPEGQIINFDGNAPQGDFRRWDALRTVEASNTFRSVWGDAAMGNQVRMLLEYQYYNLQDTASDSLDFINDYYNNGDGQQHVATPHPVNFYLWGAGGAVYFGSPDPAGEQTAITIAGSSFETPVIPAGSVSVSPAGSGWAFTGNSGIYNAPHVSGVATATNLGTATTPAVDLAVGYSFTVGATPIAVYDLGRWVSPGNIETHTISIFDTTNDQLATTDIDTSTSTPGQYDYAALSHPVILQANTTYYIVSLETANGDSYYGDATTLSAASGVRINGAIHVSLGAPESDQNQWVFSPGASGNHAGGPVDFKFTATPVGTLGFPPLPTSGTQAAFVGDTGTLSTTINFSSTGVFAFEFDGANKDADANAFRIYLDGTEITPNSNSYIAANSPWTPSQNYYGGDPRDFNNLGTAPFTITATGNHVLKIVGSGAVGTYSYIDSVKVTSLDAIFNAGIIGLGPSPGTAQAADAAYQAQLNLQARYARQYGLNVVAYEGGWSFNETPLEGYAKFVDPREAQATIASLDDFALSGGSLYMVGTWESWLKGDQANSDGYPIAQGIDATDDTLPPLPTNPAPSIFPQTALPAPAAQNVYDPTITSSGGVELGVKFRSDTSGYVTGVRFWKGAQFSGAQTGELWSSTGQLLATATFSQESAGGWQRVYFSAPVAIAANTTYIVSYHTTSPYIAYTSGAFAASGANNAPLHALASGIDGSNSVYHYGATSFPSLSNGQSPDYWVDVIFSPVLPAAPSTPFNLTVLADSATQVTVSWADSFGEVTAFHVERSSNGVNYTELAGNLEEQFNYVDNTAQPGTTYWYRIRAENAGSFSGYSVTKITTPAAANSAAVSIFSSTSAPSPALQNVSDPTITADGGVTLGLKFRSDVAGTITGVRFWKGTLDTGVHTGELWSSTGQLLATAAFTGESASGWQQVTFSSPVTITANTTYIVSYHTTASYIAYTAATLAGSGVDNPPLHALANGVDGNNSVYHYDATPGTPAFPTLYNGQAPNYWVDVLFSPGATISTIFGSSSGPGTNQQNVNDPTITANGGVDLGVKFRSDVAGTVMGVRFWKGSQDTGVQTGQLWSSTGQLLASATFTNETASGWQQVTFSNPVTIAANATYIVSYHTTGAYIAYTPAVFSSAGIDNAPLHALANGVDGGNSVYHYDTTPGTAAFPSLYNGQAANYWVDVLFQPTTG